MWEADAATWRFTFVSNQAVNILGYAPAEWTSDPAFWSDHIHPDDRSWATHYCQTHTAQKRAHDFTCRITHKDGRIVWIRYIVTVVVEHDKPVKLRGVMMDVTEAKQAEEALRQAEERQRHSQKLEAVGRLAGGGAHDFNNILTVITGYCELMLRQARPDDPVRRQLDEVHRAADRAASLTRQLLAFSRKQVLQPQALDLNQIVTGMEKMLRRLITGSAFPETGLYALSPFLIVTRCCWPAYPSMRICLSCLCRTGPPLRQQVPQRIH